MEFLKKFRPIFQKQSFLSSGILFIFNFINLSGICKTIDRIVRFYYQHWLREDAEVKKGVLYLENLRKKLAAFELYFAMSAEIKLINPMVHFVPDAVSVADALHSWRFVAKQFYRKMRTLSNEIFKMLYNFVVYSSSWAFAWILNLFSRDFNHFRLQKIIFMWIIRIFSSLPISTSSWKSSWITSWF